MLDNWRTIAKLLENKYKVILADLRNHGRSPHADDMNYNMVSPDVVGLGDDWAVEETGLIGAVAGGEVATQFAAQDAERVSKLIVRDISPAQYNRHHDAVLSGIGAVEPPNPKDGSGAEN